MARRYPTIAALALLAAIGGGIVFQSSSPQTEPAAVRDTPNSGEVTFDFAAFERQLAELAIEPAAQESVGRLIPVAKRRSEIMQELIAKDPQRALDRSVSWSSYAQAPDSIRPFLERPFSELADLHSLPVCGPKPLGAPDVVFELDLGGTTHAAFPVGVARSIGSKIGVPLSGITLGEVAAIRESPLEVLSDEDEAATAALPLVTPDRRHCFATGRPVQGRGASALIGGRRAVFSDAAAAGEFGRRLRALDLAPGPHTGSRVVFELADGEPGEGFDWQAAGELVENQADTWTETPKNVLFIRIDFSDLPGESVSQATLASSLATTSASIMEMSYGKTWLNPTVSPAVIRMPFPTTHYLPSQTSDLHTHAKNAYELAYGSNSLAPFDIIGVHFADIGLQSSSGFDFAGLAGGSRQWLQGTSNPNVVIHEFGHNYGVGHASFWQASGSDIVGAGSNSEYGDIFDIMGSGPDPEGHFHMQAKQRLGWIDSSQWVDANTGGSGTYRIYRIDHQGTSGAHRAIRAEKSGAPAEYYWIGYRAGIGNPFLANGAYLLWQRPGFARSWLLDTTPGSAAEKEDAALAVGTTYSDTAAGVHFTPVGTGGSGADAWIDINVQLGSFPGNVAPTVSISGPAAADARSPVQFTASANDANGDPLAYSWDFGDAAVSPNSATVSKTWLSGGTYTVELTVSDMKGGTATDTLSVTVTDPINSWTQRTSGVTADLYDLATDGAKVVAVGDSSGTYLSSNDGSTWGNSGTLGINIRLMGIIHDGTQWLAAGYDYDFNIGAWVGVIYTSPDAMTWTRRIKQGQRLLDIAYGDGVYVAVGNDGTLRRSTDSITWSQIATGVSQDLDGVSYGNGTFVAVGAGSPGNAGGPVAVLTSTDGLAWTDRSSGAGTASWQGFYDVEFTNDRFLASGWFSKIRHSTDGGQTFDTNLTETHQIPAFAFGGGVYFAAGIDKGNQDADINLISTDGENWGALATVDQQPRNGALFFNNTFITVGDSGSIWQSDPISDLSPFAAWLAANFPAGTDPSDDPDGDGVVSLIEYATGTDPNDRNDAAPPAQSFDGSHLSLTIDKDPSATDVTYAVQYSTDLAGWSTSGITVVTDTASQLVVRIPTGPVRGFLRVVLSVPS